MKTLIFFVILAVLALPLAAQNQEGSVAIAKSAEPTPMLLAEGVSCINETAKTLGPKEAKDYCLQLAKSEVKRGIRVANEAADATKASRPIVFADRYGYGYYRSYGYGGYRYRGRTLRSNRPLRPNRQLQQYPAPPIPGVR